MDTHIDMDQTLHDDKFCGRVNAPEDEVQYTE